MSGKNNKFRTITYTIAFKLIFVSNFLFSQNYISGKIIDIANKPLSEVSVLLYKNDSLKDYTFSDLKGNYSFKVFNGK
jgi:hypothetical protein